MTAGAQTSTPSLNDNHHRANLEGTDLGWFVEHQGRLFMFYGDTSGYRGIWPGGDHMPDAVATLDAGLALIANTPALLCSDTRFLLVSPNSPIIGASFDPTIVGEFDAVRFDPPVGERLVDYISNVPDSGQNAEVGGSWEVPSGAFSFDGGLFVTYASKPNLFPDHPLKVMTTSFVAEFRPPQRYPRLSIIRRLDALGTGSLGGNFINVAPVVKDGVVYFYGTGRFRRSDVSLVRVRNFNQPNELTEVWAGGGWARNPLQLEGLLGETGLGELSVQYFSELGRWVMVYATHRLAWADGAVINDAQTVENRIILRWASRPEGPWSSPVLVADRLTPAFRAEWCQGAGGSVMDCDRGGNLYGPALFPKVLSVDRNRVRLLIQLSTFVPYKTVLAVIDAPL